MSERHIHSFNAKALLEVDDGKLAGELNRQLEMLIQDICDRPMDADGDPTKARKLKMQYILTPIIAACPDTRVPMLKSIEAVAEVDASRPKTTGRPIDLRLLRGQLVWNPGSQDEFGQLPLFDEEEALGED